MISPNKRMKSHLPAPPAGVISTCPRDFLAVSDTAPACDLDTIIL